MRQRQKVMSESIKAIRATVAVGDLTVDAFMLPSGEYLMSQVGAAAAIADAPVYALRFLKTNDSKLLLGQAFTDYNPDVIEVEYDVEFPDTWQFSCDIDSMLSVDFWE